MTSLLLIIGGGTVIAQSSSNNYQLNESFFGPGGELESESPNFRTAPGGQSLGNPGGGESSSPNFGNQAGNPTTDDPSLACTINTGSANFGSLSTSVPSTATAEFSVLNYTSYGYVVNIVGDPPSMGSHELNDLESGGTSTPGTEQFGINLVDNSSPDIGADPQQVPNNTFSFGEAASNYDTANNFRYVEGETIAQSVRSSGQTDYTISYLINISNTTPGGQYSGNQAIVCTGTY